MGNPDLGQFPTLSKNIDWGSIKASFSLTNSVDDTLVSNVSIIPCVGERYVVFQIDSGMWELPGGTLEAGENYIKALRREVMEELGAELLTYHVFGQFNCESRAKKPYKPHIPHPYFHRIVGYGEVNLVGKPLNPEDGEKVVAVEIVDIEEAVNRFIEQNRKDLAELYILAHLIKNQEGTDNQTLLKKEV